jgi:hypothetical protein
MKQSLCQLQGRAPAALSRTKTPVDFLTLCLELHKNDLKTDI